MKILILFFFFISTCYAGQVLVPGYGVVNYDDDVSFKIYSQKDMSATNFNGKVIYASSFMQEKPNTKVFAKDMCDVTFVKCDLKNVKIENWKNVNFIQCDMRKFKVQPDGQDYWLDNKYKPTKKINEE